jgi:hypothetical protein
MWFILGIRKWRERESVRLKEGEEVEDVKARGGEEPKGKD